MTVIAARKYEDRIEFAADSQTTAGYRRLTKQEHQTVKIHGTDRMTVGGAGHSSHSQWFFNFMNNRSPLLPSESYVAEFMLEFSEWMRKKDSSFRNENQFLLAMEDQLFYIYDELSVFEVPEFAAVGSGGDYATAALHLGHTPRKAAEVAAQLDIYCSGDLFSVVHEF